MPVTRRAGVTSKPGLATGLPGATIRTRAASPEAFAPETVATSSASRSSMGMASAAPVIDQSIEGEGAAT
jgi:hypothetical protein